MAKSEGKRLGFITTFAVTLVLILWVVLVTWIVVGIRNGSLSTLWRHLGDGQAQILSSSIAALGLLSSAVLVPFIFKDRIRDLDSAVGEMSKTIENFENEASEKLEKLSSLLTERMADLEKRGSEDVDRLGDLLEEIRSAVILSVSDGQITDPKHAKVFVQHLYNNAIAALKKRVREKPYLREVTKTQIAELPTMSRQYLDKLIECQIITPAERSVVDRVKEFAYRRSDFAMQDINLINNTRTKFDNAFGESTVSDVDAN